jgi:hypothetical protein
MQRPKLFNFILLCIGLIGLISYGQNITNNDLPKLLVANDGAIIENSDDWVNIRRPEIIALFENSVYGKVPDTQLNISYKVLKIDNNALEGKAIQKEVIATFSNGMDSLEMNMLIFLPKGVEKPVPVFLGMNFYGNQTIHPDPNITITPSYVNNNEEFFITNNKATELSRGVRSHRWPIEKILERGYGLVSIYYGDIDPDFDDDFKNGIHKLFYKDKEQPAPDEWGSIATWAYGLSKAMDYLETDEDIDKNKVAVIGHSRLGKTALWAGAMDQRFAMTISNDSGCGGAALFRRKQGETIEKINKNFPHWFCKNFHAYNDKEEDLPVDQHMLIGMIAPRPVYVASASEDLWADPEGEYLSLYYSGEVYSLFGLENLESDKMPETDQSRTSGNMGYHIRSGKHDLTLFDWEKYMDFADVHFN